ncbi:MAG: hypothetical protein SFV53_04575 [Rickettsiales bacterium]|nr:hypothetical protein [Rickettsiales bacterium]
MDDKTAQVLKLIQSHYKIRNFLTILCYSAIIGGFFIYAFYALSKSNHNIKLVKQYNQNPENYKVEKIMTNPRIDFQYDDGQVYHISAKKAHHIDEQQVILYDVLAKGDIGNIKSGKLEVNEQGDHLVFSENPNLILNSSKNLSIKKYPMSH